MPLDCSAACGTTQRVFFIATFLVAFKHGKRRMRTALRETHEPSTEKPQTARAANTETTDDKRNKAQPEGRAHRSIRHLLVPLRNATPRTHVPDGKRSILCRKSSSQVKKFRLCHKFILKKTISRIDMAKYYSYINNMGIYFHMGFSSSWHTRKNDAAASEFGMARIRLLV